MPPDAGRHLSSVLGKLVDQGTVTKDQADKIISFFKQKDSERKADREKMKTMTPEERQAYLQQRQDHRTDLIADLKDAADLSDEQTKTVVDALRPPHQPPPEGPMPPWCPDDKPE